jgi:ankyrin repeat protein
MTSPANGAHQARANQSNFPQSTQAVVTNSSSASAPSVSSNGTRAALRDAARCGDIEVLADLLDSLQMIDEVLDVRTGETALSAAAENGQYDVVDVLLEANAGVGKPGARSLANAVLAAVKSHDSAITELIFAKRSNEIAHTMPILKLLRNKPANTEACDAVISRHQGSINPQPNLHAGVPVITTNTASAVTTTTTTGPTTTSTATSATTLTSPVAQTTALQITFTDDQVSDMLNSAKAGDIDSVKAWLDQGMSVAARKSGSDETALGLAARKGKLDMVKFILSHGTAVDFTRLDKQTAINATFNVANEKAITLAISHTDGQLMAGNTLVTEMDIFEAKQGHRQLEETSIRPAGHSSNAGLINSLAPGYESSGNSSASAHSSRNVMTVTEDMKNALHDAARSGDLPLIQQLIDNGMPMDTKLGTGNETVLEIAARRGKVEVINYLVTKGASNLSYAVKTSAIQAAATNGHAGIVKSLLDLFIDPASTKHAMLKQARENKNDFAVRTFEGF